MAARVVSRQVSEESDNEYNFGFGEEAPSVTPEPIADPDPFLWSTDPFPPTLPLGVTAGQFSLESQLSKARIVIAILMRSQGLDEIVIGSNIIHDILNEGGTEIIITEYEQGLMVERRNPRNPTRSAWQRQRNQQHQQGLPGRLGLPAKAIQPPAWPRSAAPPGSVGITPQDPEDDNDLPF